MPRRFCRPPGSQAKRQVPADAIAWLTAEIDGVHAARDVRRLSIAVAGARRKMGRADLEPFPEDLAAARRGCPGWQPQLLSVDEAARILLLLSRLLPRRKREALKCSTQ